MIVLNTINHENKSIEYHFIHDDFKGIVFKINSRFDIIEEDGEYYFGCEYDELEHVLNAEHIEPEDIKRVCDEFAMASLQSLYKNITENPSNLAKEISNDSK